MDSTIRDFKTMVELTGADANISKLASLCDLNRLTVRRILNSDYYIPSRITCDKIQVYVDRIRTSF